MSQKSQRNTTQNKHKPLTTQPCTCCEPTKVVDKLHMHHETVKLIGQRHQKGNVRNTTTRTPAFIRMGLLPAESQRAGFHQPWLCWDHSIACAPESAEQRQPRGSGATLMRRSQRNLTENIKQYATSPAADYWTIGAYWKIKPSIFCFRPQYGVSYSISAAGPKISGLEIETTSL